MSQTTPSNGSAPQAKHEWHSAPNLEIPDDLRKSLDTWGRHPMIFHPHAHFVVPRGKISEDAKKWLATPSTFLFPEAVAARVAVVWKDGHT